MKGDTWVYQRATIHGPYRCWPALFSSNVPSSTHTQQYENMVFLASCVVSNDDKTLSSLPCMWPLVKKFVVFFFFFHCSKCPGIVRQCLLWDHYILVITNDVRITHDNTGLMQHKHTQINSYYLCGVTCCLLRVLHFTNECFRKVHLVAVQSFHMILTT